MIRGVTITNNEGPILIAVDGGKTLGVELKTKHVLTSHRVPTFKHRAMPSLIVHLSDRRLRNTCIAAYKKNRWLTAEDISPALPNNNVYVKDHLSSETKNHLTQTKIKGKETNYKYV
ncbi:hypothetical protein J6590_079177 [Homalodisca vitripennis]|nr:hypothetical protein J6590_079177 [Homalodisca vitripennis]